MPKNVESIKHKADTRARIPSNEEAGYEAASPKVQGGKTTLELPKNPVTHRGQDPELFWLGKYGNDDRDNRLRVDIRSLYRHEHIAPEVLISRLHRTVQKQPDQEALFSINELFGNALDSDELEKVSEYYRHRDGWTNRLIQGDSLLVMTSLLEREGMAGQVQCIYLDPPYGIKYGSNWQVRLNNRDVKDGSDEALASEPEVIKAFRDTWELGIHSYLSYNRDRLLVARELLSESGSCFVQISDENVHLVRSVMDEVFGSENFVSLIAVKKTAGLGTDMIPSITDYVVWYARSKNNIKYRPLFREKSLEGDQAYSMIKDKTGSTRRMTIEEANNHKLLPKEAEIFRHQILLSAGRTPSCIYPIDFNGKTYLPTANRSWATNQAGMKRLIEKKRVVQTGNTLSYIRFASDFPLNLLPNFWDDTASGSSMDKLYVVQTTTKVIQRCLLMTTDPGDLVLDPTCVRRGTRVFTPLVPPEIGGKIEPCISLASAPSPNSGRAGVGFSSPISDSDGVNFTPIEDLRPNDYVYSHDGKIHRVVRTIVKRHRGAMYGIRHSRSASVLWVTGDHRVLIRRRQYRMNGHRTWEHVPHRTFANARALRNNPTASERRFWAAVRGEQLGVKFRRQHPIGAYIADFFCPERALVVEIDGDSHCTPAQQEYDAARTEAFRALGIEVVRYSNSDVAANIGAVLEDVRGRTGEKANDFWDDAVWLRAEYLREGDIVYYGERCEPAEIRALHCESADEEVYDIEVEGAHSFITETCAVHNCGSGTTAFVAEQWGRRWITIDTSRIALNIAKTRLMTAVYPYYTLHDEAGGDVRQGFVYKTVPHITLKSLANDEPPEIETLYDQPNIDAKRLRVSGPFTVETLQAFEPLSPEELAEQVRPSEIEGGFEEIVKQHLLSAGIKNGRKNEMVVFRSVETLSNEHLHAEGFYTSDGGEKKAYFHIGPKFGTVSKHQVNEAIKECRARGDANWLVILGFSFESNIEGSQQTTSLGTFEVTKCRIHDDLLQDGLKKKPAKSAASFVTIGEPDIVLKRSSDSTVRVEVLGLDIYDPIKDEVKARNLSDIAYWMVDDDYDGSNFVVRQVFFCGGGGGEFDKWKKGLDSLAKASAKKKTEKTLKIELDDEAFDRLYGHVSHPIPLTKTGQKIAVRIVSQFGEECTKVLPAENAAADAGE